MGARPRAGFALLFALSLSCGADDKAPLSGEVLYARYCASCHGVSATGDGPVAASLRTVPSDLTTIAARAGGEFDATAVLRAIDGRRAVAAHGQRDMPVWGAVFAEEFQGQRYAGYAVLLRSRALTDYLRTIQVESDH